MIGSRNYQFCSRFICLPVKFPGRKNPGGYSTYNDKAHQQHIDVRQVKFLFYFSFHMNNTPIFFDFLQLLPFLSTKGGFPGFFYFFTEFRLIINFEEKLRQHGCP